MEGEKPDADIHEHHAKNERDVSKPEEALGEVEVSVGTRVAECVVLNSHTCVALITFGSILPA